MVARDRSLDMLEPLKRQITPRAPSFTVDYDSQFAPAEFVGHDAEVVAAIERALDVYRAILIQEEFSVTVQVRWGTLDSSTLMQTQNLGRDSRSWGGLTGVRAQFVADSFLIDDETFETNIIDAMPMGSTVSYRYGASSTTSTSSICLSVPLLKKWYGAASNDPIRIDIQRAMPPLNPNDPDGTRLKWILDTRLTPAMQEEEVDFFGSLVHEMGHGLGFWSELEPAQSIFYNVISNWDIFRMPTSLAPIGASTFESEPRELRPSLGALGVTGIGTTLFQYPLSRGPTEIGGDGFQASHWLRFPQDPIGIMDPVSLNGVNYLINGSYLQDSDIRAFDVMGYNILLNSIQPPARPAPLLSPSSDAILRQTDIILEWQAAIGASSYGVVIHDLGVSGTEDLIVVYSDLSIDCWKWNHL